MFVYLVRHAHAGQRQDDHHDLYRPLSDRGEARAVELVSLFEGTLVGLIISSPATRCLQTVAPLAQARGLDVAEYPDLWEDAHAGDALTLLEQICEGLGDSPTSLVVCSHGNIIPELVDLLSRRGVPVQGHGCEKGSVWELTYDDDWAGARRIKRKATSLAR